MAIRSLTRSLTLIGTVLLIAACGSEGTTPGTSSASTGVPSTGSPPTTAVAVTPAATPSPSAASMEPAVDESVTAGLVILGEADGARGLWRLAPSGAVSKIGPVSGTGRMTIGSSGKGIVLADGKTLEWRAAGDLAVAARSTILLWPASTPPFVDAIAISPEGKIALAIGAQDHVVYATVSVDGRVSDPQAAPSQPFTPLVAWLDETRRLVLTTDTKQQTRFTTWSGGSDFSTGKGGVGCRWFAVSGNGKVLAVATDGQVSAGGVEGMLAGTSAAPIAQIADQRIAWGMALNRDGTKLAFLEGTIADDGSVTNVHNRMLVRSGETWQAALDVPVTSLTRVIGQAWSS